MIEEKYAFHVVCLSLLLTIVSYLLGAAILYFIDPLLGFLFLILCVLTIILSLRYRCKYCYYYGERCSSGFGKLCKFLLISKGDPEEFTNLKKVVPVAILSFSTLLFPILGGILLILIDFSVFNIVLLGIYIVFGICPNFILRGRFCEKCEQGKRGCFAYEQMMKGKKAE